VHGISFLSGDVYRGRNRSAAGLQEEGAVARGSGIRRRGVRGGSTRCRTNDGCSCSCGGTICRDGGGRRGCIRSCSHRPNSVTQAERRRCARSHSAEAWRSNTGKVRSTRRFSQDGDGNAGQERSDSDDSAAQHAQRRREGRDRQGSG